MIHESSLSTTKRVKINRKLYFLRLKRLVKLFKNYSKLEVSACLFGKLTYNALCHSEASETLAPSARHRIMCMVWILLLRHKFEEVARIVIHTLHSFSISPCWLWRVVFHIFRCLNRPEQLFKFRKVLAPIRFADENNRILETMLYQLTLKDWDAASKERSLKVYNRDASSSKEAFLTREPEINFVQRLQRLYEGLSYYALWCEAKISSADESFITDKSEKAIYRLTEVEMLINCAHVCDVFIQPLMQLLRHNKQDIQSLALLNRYASTMPYHPNTHLYLAQWYIENTTSLDGGFVNGQLLRRVFSLPIGTVPPPVEETLLVNRRLQGARAKHIDPLLYHLVQYVMCLLPEPAPKKATSLPSNRKNENEQENHVLEECTPYTVLIEICLYKGYSGSALDLIFLLLDHPSWCRFSRLWNLLLEAINSLGINSSLLCDAWSLREFTWQKCIFRRRDLPKVAKTVKSVLKQVKIERDSQTVVSSVDSIDDFGPILAVQTLYSINENETKNSFPKFPKNL